MTRTPAAVRINVIWSGYLRLWSSRSNLTWTGAPQSFGRESSSASWAVPPPWTRRSAARDSSAADRCRHARHHLSVRRRRAALRRGPPDGPGSRREWVIAAAARLSARGMRQGQHRGHRVLGRRRSGAPPLRWLRRGYRPGIRDIAADGGGARPDRDRRAHRAVYAPRARPSRSRRHVVDRAPLPASAHARSTRSSAVRERRRLAALGPPGSLTPAPRRSRRRSW